MAEIALRNGGVTLVDDADYEWLARYTWAGYMMKSGRRYVMTDEAGVRIYMHRLIIGAAPDLEVDHRNGNPLDNRRDNLREVTHAQNQQNRRCGYGVTGYRNVYLNDTGRYHVKLVVNGKSRSFGAYGTIEEAVHVAHAARQSHLPFSEINDIPTGMAAPEWRPCSTAPGYFVARDGRVRSPHGMILKPYRRKNGPLALYLLIDGRRVYHNISKLVAAVYSD